MGALRSLVRALSAVAGLVLLGLGAIGFGLAFAPEQMPRAELERALDAAPSLPAESSEIAELLAHPATRLGSSLGGLVLLFVALRARGPRDEGSLPAARDRGAGDAAPMSRAVRRDFMKEAAHYQKNGQAREAADLYADAGEYDRAVALLEEADELERAAEVRMREGEPVAAGELYERAGRGDLAARTYADAGEHARAARCYAERSQQGLAAEMFEEAGMHRQAGDCYSEIDFHRHAAQAYVKAQEWQKAAHSLEAVLAEEFVGAAVKDQARHREMLTLVKRAARLHEEAGNAEAAIGVLERGGCMLEAAEIAERLGREEEAAELYTRGGDAPRAAEALRRLGREREADRMLADHHRDRGDDKQAAELFERAGELGAAGELYRKLEAWEKAGDCLAGSGDPTTAAEMYRAAGLAARAAETYESASRYHEAADCWAEAEEPLRRAAALERASRLLEAGQIHLEQGQEDQAIEVLQRVGSDHRDFRAASATLGRLFRGRGLLAVAAKKLRAASAGQDVTRDTVEIFYHLARTCEETGELEEAVDLYERVLAFDYRYDDAESRLEAAREKLRAALAADTGPGNVSLAVSSPATPDRYQIIGELGRGGMGIVYKAKDSVLDRIVAYKVLPDALKENPQALRNFLREAKSAAQLNHPNIVTVYDAGEQNGRYYIAMEYVDGTTLKEIVRKKGAIKARGVLRVLAQMCEALAYAHDKGIVHRDIKTANTMWTRDRKAKIMDFGLARAIEEVRNHTTLVSGTPFYMSPEQTLGKHVDHRTDIYSLGVTVFELATGRVPFREGNVPYHHVHSAPPDPRELNPKVPELLARIVARCLKKSPDARYQNAREILSEVKSALARR